MDLPLDVHVFPGMVVSLSAAALYQVHKRFLRNAYRGDNDKHQNHEIGAHGSDNGDQSFGQKAADQAAALTAGRRRHIDIHQLPAGSQPRPKQELAESAERD